jgi:diguanylate cyclase (GGDEF)-like protein
MPGEIATGTTSEAGPSPEWRHEHAGSGLTSVLMLAYVEREAGREGVDRMLRLAGLTDREQELRDESSWFSFETKIKLWAAAEAVTGEPRVAERVGESVVEFSVALALKQAVRALGSPEFVFRNIARANGKFNCAHQLEVVDRDTDRVRLAYRDISDVGYHHYDCDYTIGLLRTVPQLFGLPAARVAHPLCGVRGDDHCEYDVHWVGELQRVKRATVLGGVVAAALALVGALTDPFLLALGVGLGAAAALIAGVRVAVFRRARVAALETRVREQDLAAEAQLESLAALSSELRLDEVLNRISASASSAMSGAQFALLLAEGERMRVFRTTEVPEDPERELELWAQASAEALRGGPIVIDDLASVPALKSLTAHRELQFGSACAAALVFRDRLLGVLIALAPGERVFLPHDVRSLETYAGHAAIALANAQRVGQLERSAMEDPLTGLANKRAFHRACAAEAGRAAREESTVALVMLDIDHFKEINDTYGHPFGDYVLAAVAKALRAAVRAHDTVARLGGEEFALVLPGSNSEAAYDVAERARELIARIELPKGHLASSAGVAVTGGEGASAKGLLDAADRALYDAKRTGRDRTALAGAPT